MICSKFEIGAERMAEEAGNNKSDNEVVEEKTKGNQKLKIIIILCVTLIVISGLVTATALIVMKGGDSATTLPQSEQPSETEETDDAAEELEETASQTPYFYKFLPPFVVNLPTKGRVKFLQIEVELMATNEDVIEDVESIAPLIKNDLLQLYSMQKYEDMMIPSNRELLRQESLKVVNKLLSDNIGRDGVKQVLFTSFIAQ